MVNQKNKSFKEVLTEIESFQDWGDVPCFNKNPPKMKLSPKNL